MLSVVLSKSSQVTRYFVGSVVSTPVVVPTRHVTPEDAFSLLIDILQSLGVRGTVFWGVVWSGWRQYLFRFSWCIP